MQDCKKRGTSFEHCTALNRLRDHYRDITEGNPCSTVKDSRVTRLIRAKTRLLNVTQQSGRLDEVRASFFASRNIRWFSVRVFPHLLDQIRQKHMGAHTGLAGRGLQERWDRWRNARRATGKYEWKTVYSPMRCWETCTIISPGKVILDLQGFVANARLSECDVSTREKTDER